MGVKQLSLKRPTVEGFPLLSEDDQLFFNDIATESLKENDTLRVNGKDRKPKHESLWSFKWSEIIEIKEQLAELNVFQLLKIVFGLTQNEFRKLDFLNSMACYRWITAQIVLIRNAEQSELSSDLTAQEKNAGAETLFEDLGDFTSLDDLANGDILKHKEILSKPYSTIFTKMVLNKRKNEYQKNLHNASRKN